MEFSPQLPAPDHLELSLVWDDADGVYREEGDDRPITGHWHTVGEAADIVGEPGVTVQGGPLGWPRPKFDALLEAAERLPDCPEWRALIVRLSEFAVQDAAPLLMRDLELRRRWDIVFASTDGWDLQAPPSTQLDEHQAALRAEKLLALAERALSGGWLEPEFFAAVLLELREMESGFGVELYREAGLSDRFDCVVSAVKEAS